MRVILPWPHKILWPNGSEGSRYGKSGAKKKARDDASWAAIAARQQYGIPDFGEGEIAVRLIVHAKPKGPLPDKDNCVAAVKVQLDSIAKEMGVNDRRFAAPVVQFRNPRDGHIEVEFFPTFIPTFENNGETNPLAENAGIAINSGPENGSSPPAPAHTSTLQRSEEDAVR